MNHGCYLTVSPFNTFQARFKEFGDVGLSSTLKVYKVFTTVSQGPWLRGDCLGPNGVINCTPLSALSFWVSLFPGTRGYNNWIHGYGTCRYEGLTVYYTTKIPKATSWEHSTGLIQQIRNWGLERSSDLPKVTMLVQGQGRTCGCSYTARLSPCRPTGKQAVEWHKVGRSRRGKTGQEAQMPGWVWTSVCSHEKPLRV